MVRRPVESRNGTEGCVLVRQSVVALLLVTVGSLAGASSTAADTDAGTLVTHLPSRTVGAGTRVSITGTASPTGRQVLLQARTANGWVGLGTTKAAADGSFTFAAPTWWVARQVLRVYTPATTDTEALASATTGTLKVTRTTHHAPAPPTATSAESRHGGTPARSSPTESTPTGCPPAPCATSTKRSGGSRQPPGCGSATPAAPRTSRTATEATPGLPTPTWRSPGRHPGRCRALAVGCSASAGTRPSAKQAAGTGSPWGSPCSTPPAGWRPGSGRTAQQREACCSCTSSPRARPRPRL